MSYSDFRRNPILNWSFFHSSAHSNFISSKSHFIQTPCFPCNFLHSVALVLTYTLILCALSSAITIAADTFEFCWKYDISMPCRPVLVFPMMSCKYNSLFVFISVLCWIPVLAILSSAESHKAFCFLERVLRMRVQSR